MRKNIVLTFILAIAALVPAAAFGQTAVNVKPSVVTGDVTSISDAKIVLKTKDGDLEVLLSDKTDYKRVPPENPVLKAAVASSRTDIGEGDKLLVTGVFGEDKKVLPARAVYLMTKSDLAQKTKADTEKWTTRGVSGKIMAVNAQTNQITLESRGLANTTTVTVTPKADAKFLRYAPNSVKFSEAVASSISDLKAGDMMRAAGEKGADGTKFAAEEVISGAFQTIAGTVKSVDVANNSVVITNSQTKKDVTIDLSLASTLKKFPEEMANRMAQLQGGGGRPGAAGGQSGTAAGTGRTAAGGTPATAGGPPEGAGQGRGGFGGARGGIDEMLERFPNITAADLKVGDVIAISSTKTQNVDHVTAIKLLAGVEPFLRIAQASSAGGQRGGRGQGADGGFTIPGLDGFGGP
ncbi:MAG: hypothetical protein ABI791_09435 [Acidobacteriota bacterium]